MKIKKVYTYFFSLSFLAFLLCFSHNALAADLSISSDTRSVNVGDTVRVKINVSSAAQSVNAVSASISFTKNVLSVQSLSKTNSIISLWAVEPSYSNSSGTVSLEGVALNGYKGSGGTVLTIVFKAKAAGTASIQIPSGSILANDGEGTNILNARTGLSITVLNAVEKEKTPPPAEVPIVTPPASIKAAIEIEELKKKDEMDLHSRFLITSTLRNKKVPYRVEIDSASYSWNDSDDHIFQTEELAKGTHSIKVYMESTSDEIISNSALFTTGASLEKRPERITPETVLKTTSDLLSLIIPVISLFILLLLIILYGWRRIAHYRANMRNRLHETEALVDKSFSILDEDLEEEVKIFKKIKSREALTEDERGFVTQFKKDLRAAEKTILSDIKDSDKAI